MNIPIFSAAIVLALSPLVDRKATGEPLHEFTDEQKGWWAFQPLSNEIVPEIADARWDGNEIDRYVFEALERNGLTPSPEADRGELARRVYFDLIGLPPTADELSEFVGDGDGGAYARLVDKLLASPRYGERWAQHWLDLVRYAESDGFRADAYRPNAWPYRDYVIRAFNGDMPYDQFVREQLAGDEIDADNPDVLVATGFLRQGIYEYNNRDIRGHWDAIINEVTDVTGDVFLGLSFQCARCHDHKFDPILQADYFRLRSFFSPLAWRDDLKLATGAEKAEYRTKLKVWENATKEIREEMDAIARDALDKKREEAVEKFPEDIQLMMRKPASERDPLEEQFARLAHRQVVYEEERFNPDSSIKGEPGERYKALEEELKKFSDMKPSPLRSAFVATDIGTAAPATTFIGKRGEVEVEPGFLTIIEPGETKVEQPEIATSTGRRLALANWITKPDNPLSTRVIVNRVWQLHFGQGLVPTPSDFGELGEEPSHPGLLDWLARTFVEDGWSLKKLHRRIVLSETYRQTAQREPGEKEAMEDPQNRLLWRFSPRRLDAGEARDALLLASGELEQRSGGPSLGGGSRCRTIYLKKVRNTPDEFIRQFDGPSGFNSEPVRSSTTTPTQSLLMINSEWAVARAMAMAENLLKTHNGAVEPLVVDAYLRLFGRAPLPDEIADGSAFIQEMEKASIDPLKVAEVKIEAGLEKADAHFSDVDGIGPTAFPFDAKSRRLEIDGAMDGGDVFTVEAVVNLESIYPDASVRTVASRWNGEAGRLSAIDQGWALGITSTKSRYEPRNLIVQLVGEDFQGNVTYEVVASDLRVPIGVPCYIGAVISTLPTPDNKTGGTVTFYVQELRKQGAEMQVAKVDHQISTGLVVKGRKMLMGGRDGAGHLFHGSIARLRLAGGVAMGKGKSPFADPGGAGEIADLLGEGENLPKKARWLRTEGGSGSGEVSAKQRAVADFCHVLMNSNEFLYLH